MKLQHLIHYLLLVLNAEYVLAALDAVRVVL
jgi:hypothetical protein